VYILTAMILIAMGNPNSGSAGALVMAFAAGVVREKENKKKHFVILGFNNQVMFGVGALYILIAVFSCCKCFPIPCCVRCGRGYKYNGEDTVYHEYKWKKKKEKKNFQ
jgi:hypothetical protein